ncbi:prominin-1-A [Galleria mellonella]|uniref:Prominin-1-A n=1 Tax=Galleria mellonella TaxID=7137 RepID=A0ABM3MVC7_GALME|nr:prominin-1-A [Galleria mellonella]
MAVINLIFAILLLNRVTSQTSRTASHQESALNTLQENSTETIFTLQTRQIRATSETPLRAGTGNNLHTVESTVPNDRHPPQQHYQAISAIYSIKPKDKKRAVDERNDKSFLLNKKLLQNDIFRKNLSNPNRLVWDNCLEPNFRNNLRNLVESPRDMDDDNNDLPTIQNNKETGNILNKRDGDTANNLTIIKSWLDIYNSLKNSKTEERKQQKQDFIPVKKITQPFTNADITTNVESTTTVRIIPITREIFRKNTGVMNVTQNTIITENNIKASYTEDWFVANDKSKIRFSGLPHKEKYLIPTLKLENGFYPFTFMSEFFTLIYPFDFPVGLIKDIVWGKFTFPYSFLQSIKIESTFLGFIVLFACIALVIPSYLLVISILSIFSRSRCDDETETGALFPEAHDSDCNERIFVFVTLFTILLCCALISGMVVSNEQAHEAAEESRKVISYACADIASWLSAAARDLHHSLIPPVDLVLHAYQEDLKDIEPLLGDPIQHSIASESGIDLVFDSLADIIEETEDLSTKISSLREVSIRAGNLAATAAERIKDLARQIENLKKFCVAKDAPLCDTINTNSLVLQLKFELILQEQQLLQLRSLGVNNMTNAISAARKDFKRLPSVIATQTEQVRSDILRDVESRKAAIHSSSKILNDIVRYLTLGLHDLKRGLETDHDRIQKYDFWRWTLMLACLVTFSIIMMMLLLGIICGCAHAKGHGKRTLQVSAVWLCFGSLILWTVVSATFLITGHAEVYVCHALWDTPQYETLVALLDRPSPLLENDEGIFDSIFRELNNVTIDVSIKDVLRDCEKDRPAYVVFQLDKILDVNKETSYFEWQELQTDLGRLSSTIDVGLLKTISFKFNKLLNQMLIVSEVKLANYRMEYNGAVVGKDLPSLVDQLENIAAQVSDLTTAGRLETLATRTQRLYQTNIKPLEHLRAEVVFKLTELELQLMPFRRKLNISLSHIHTAQYYIDNQGEVIAQKKVSMYVSRLISHTASWRTHVLQSVGKYAARCNPLFSVYSALRTLLCSKYIASMHGWWLCGFLLGLTWCTTLTPLCVKLWRSYSRKIRSLEAITLSNLNSGQQETPTTALCDGSNWNTPGPPPPRSDSW